MNIVSTFKFWDTLKKTHSIENHEFEHTSIIFQNGHSIKPPSKLKSMAFEV